MRLGQLARHLNVSPSDIIHFLEQQSITFESATNARLDEGQIRLVLSKFAPEKLVSIDTYVAEEDEPVQSASSAQDSADAGSVQAETGPTETIRAPKVELQGLKVLGKIDLPEPKKKQPEPPSETLEQKQDRTIFRRREHRQDRPWINPLERQRQREAREAEEKKRREAELRKEMRTAAYLNRHQKSTSNKKVKIKPTAAESAEVRRPIKPKPASFFGKIWHWLTNAE